jgi:hypothetical protein
MGRSLSTAVTEVHAHLTNVQLLQAIDNVVIIGWVFTGCYVNAKKILWDNQTGVRLVISAYEPGA